MPSISFWLRAGAVALLASIYVPALARFCRVLGVFRPARSSDVKAADMVVIEDTIHCEDLHHHLPSNTIFTACEDSATTRFAWFPALGILDDPIKGVNSQGSIHVIEPKTFKSTRLKFENFGGPFITHGIDIISDSENPEAVYIFAVNHIPHPEYVNYKRNMDRGSQGVTPWHVPKAQSQLEVFHHVLGSQTAKHVRSIQHPLLKTPNDILARSPGSLYVTNDHYYSEGSMRFLEDVYFGATWSNIVHIQINQMSQSPPTLGFNATVALTGLHNNNGLGNAASHDDIAIGCATSGTLHIGRATGDTAPGIRVLESIPIDSAIDNPSFFKDAYATPEDDSSGYVLAGLSRAVDLPKTAKDPSKTEPIMAWLVQRTTAPGQEADRLKQGSGWERKLLFEDDGTRIRSASAAVMVGIDPKLEAGKKRAWLFVTGFSSANVHAVKVDL